jgi:hypothetical protein
MSRYSVVSSLWGRNCSVLEAFVQRHPGSRIISQQAPGPGEHQRIGLAGGTVHALDGFLGADEAAALKAEVAVRRAGLAEVMQGPAWEAECARRGWPAELLSRSAQGQVEQQLERAVLMAAALDRAHAEQAIDVVVVAEDVTPVGRAVTGWARQRGVPSLQLAHGLALTPPYTISESLDTDLLAVFGERGKEGFLDIGIHPDRLVSTGNPTWDDYPAMVPRRAELRAQIAASHGIPDGLPWIVFGTTWCAYVSAHNFGGLNSHCLEQFIIACRKLQMVGVAVQPIVKTRPNNSAALKDEIAELCQRHGYPPEQVLVASDDPKAWVVTADVFISMDSNLGVEAMLCGTPSINLLNSQGVMLGPCLDCYSGIVEVLPEAMLPALYHLIGNADAKAEVLAQARIAAPRYNIGIDGRATERVVELMTRMAEQRPLAVLMDTQLGLLERRPERVLALGRAAGSARPRLHAHFGPCEVWGVEADELGADLSRPHVDHLLTGRLEALDLGAAGWRHGMFDTVLLDDALHRTADPAALLRALRPWLRQDAQVLVSIHNARNLRLVQELASGRWQGERAGLNDGRHARQFSLQDLQRLLVHEGWGVAQVGSITDPALAAFAEATRPQLPGEVAMGSLALKDVQPSDLVELCAQYFVLRIRPPAG